MIRSFPIQINDLVTVSLNVDSTNTEVFDAVEMLTADAARYRWLRANAGSSAAAMVVSHSDMDKVIDAILRVSK